MPSIFDVAAGFRRNLLARDRDALKRMELVYQASTAQLDQSISILRGRMSARVASGQGLGQSWLMQEERLLLLKEQAQQALTHFGQQSALQIQNEQERSVRDAEHHQRQLASHGFADAPVGFSQSFAAVPRDAIEELVGFSGDGSPLAKLFNTFGPAGRSIVTETLTTAATLGWNPAKSARMLRESLGIGLSRAQTIMRTETFRAYRSTQQHWQKANSDVVDGWYWTSAKQRTTCAACWAMEGTFHSNDEHLDAHPQCRCTMVPKTKSWADLGFKDIEGPDTPAPKLGADLFAALPAKDRAFILGPKKFAAVESGVITLPDLVHRQRSADWGTMRREASLEQATASAAKRQTTPPVSASKPKPVEPGRLLPEDFLTSLDSQARKLFDARGVSGVPKTDESLAKSQNATLQAKLSPNPAWQSLTKELERRYADGSLIKKTQQDDVATGLQLAGPNARHTTMLNEVYTHMMSTDSSLIVAMQRAIKDELGLDTASMSHIKPEQVKKAERDWGNHQPALRAWARERYEQTQRLLAEAGVDEIVLSRGSRWNDKTKPTGVDFPDIDVANVDPLRHVTDVTTQPMTSFAHEYGAANVFARANASFAYHNVVVTVMPRSRIFAMADLGFGVRAESEVLVLGGVDKMRSMSWRSLKSSNEKQLVKLAGDVTPENRFKVVYAGISPETASILPTNRSILKETGTIERSTTPVGVGIATDFDVTKAVEILSRKTDSETMAIEMAKTLGTKVKDVRVDEDLEGPRGHFISDSRIIEIDGGVSTHLYPVVKNSFVSNKEEYSAVRTLIHEIQHSNSNAVNDKSWGKLKSGSAWHSWIEEGLVESRARTITAQIVARMGSTPGLVAQLRDYGSYGKQVSTIANLRHVDNTIDAKLWNAPNSPARAKIVNETMAVRFEETARDKGVDEATIATIKTRYKDRMWMLAIEEERQSFLDVPAKGVLKWFTERKQYDFK